MLFPISYLRTDHLELPPSEKPIPFSGSRRCSYISEDRDPPGIILYLFGTRCTCAKYFPFPKVSREKGAQKRRGMTSFAVQVPATSSLNVFTHGIYMRSRSFKSDALRSSIFQPRVFSCLLVDVSYLQRTSNFLSFRARVRGFLNEKFNMDRPFRICYLLCRMIYRKKGCFRILSKLVFKFLRIFEERGIFFVSGDLDRGVFFQ